MEINPGWVSAGAAVVGGLVVPWVSNQITAVKATQKLLFEKYDRLNAEFNDYKLHVAETYIADAKLEKILHPIERRLEAIEDDLRGQRVHA